MFRGKYFCFYYMFKRKFSVHNKILGETKDCSGAQPPGVSSRRCVIVA